MVALLTLLIPTTLAMPAWNWSATPAHFHTEAVLEQSYAVSVQGKNNLDARLVVLGAAAEYSCTGEPGEKVVRVSCSVAWVKLKGQAKVADEVDMLNQILQEWETDLPTYKVVMEFSPTGKLQLFNFAGTHPDNLRERAILESQRAMMLRLFCPFDLAFPKKEAQLKHSWAQEGWQPLFMTISDSGMAGGVVLRNGPLSDKNGYLYLESSGEGNMEVAEGGSTINVHLGSDTLFDPTAGMLAFRKVAMDAYFTAGAGSNSNVPYTVQTIVTQRIAQIGEKGSTPAQLPPGPLPPTP